MGENFLIVTYGANYSAAELSPAEPGSFTQRELRFMIRYIGWAENPKFISHYAGAYQKLVSSGHTGLLAIEEGTSTLARLAAQHHAQPSDAPSQRRGKSPRSVSQDVAEFVDNAAGPAVPP
jgi:hypothetical protein